MTPCLQRWIGTCVTRIDPGQVVSAFPPSDHQCTLRLSRSGTDVARLEPPDQVRLMDRRCVALCYHNPAMPLLAGGGTAGFQVRYGVGRIRSSSLAGEGHVSSPRPPAGSVRVGVAEGDGEI
jgi:hypothetical protein